MWGRQRLTLETGEIARQSTGAVLVTMEDTVVLVTVVGKKDADPAKDFLPLTVDYQERTYAAGKIPGGFFKREGRPSEKEILTFECHPVEKKTGSEKGTKKILDCMFIQSWRYLSAVTGNNLLLWDTERGILQASLPLQMPIKSAELSISSKDDSSYLVIETGRKKMAYRIVIKK